MAQENYEMEPNSSPRGENDLQRQLRHALLENDFEKFEELVSNGAVDLEYVYPYPDDKTCLDLAILEPNKIEFVKLLLRHITCVTYDLVDKRDTPVHLAVKNRNTEALDALLQYGGCSVNWKDKEGNSPLYYATRNGDNETVLKLLRKGAHIYDCSYEPPVADINARTLQTFLDECIETNDELPNDRNYEIRLNYDFFRQHRQTKMLLNMTRDEVFRPLLKHPVITSFIYFNWYSIRKVFYANITFSSLLWLCLMFYIILGYGVNKQQSKFVEAINVLTYVGTCIGLILLIFRELFQLLVWTTKYFKSTENFMEIAIICVMTAIVCNNSASESTKQQLSAIAILLSSAELVLLIGQFPTFSTNIVMLRTVSWNFFKFLLWYCILIIAFALSFYTLFKRGEEQEDQKASNPNNTGQEEEEEEEFFGDPGRSLFKTIVMMTGEFDAGSIKFSTFPVTSHIIFILFVFMVPVVLFNLLNGLAVSDTQDIRANAELLGHISRVKLLFHYESVIANSIKSKTLARWCIWNAFKIVMYNFLHLHYNKASVLLYVYGVTVKPNQNNKIEVSDDMLGALGGEYCFGSCDLRLDKEIVKNAQIIINKRSCVSEFDEIKHMLSKYETKILSMENTLKKVLQKIEAL